jgi:hypothetical protein
LSQRRNTDILLAAGVYSSKNLRRRITMRGLRAKRIRTVREGTLMATVDIGMASNTGYCITTDGQDIKPFKFDNTREGLDKFWDMIVISKNRFACDEVIVGYESTGPYAEPLVHYLRNKPVKIVQVNPMHTKRMKEVNDNSPLKTDGKDPRVIADIIRLGHALTVVVPEGDAALSEETQQCKGTARKGAHCASQPAPAIGLPSLP